MKVYDLVDGHELHAAIRDGLVGRQTHPTEPLAILNYTNRAQFDGAWTPVTMACRGLIYDTSTMDIVARPFAKFFNYGQPGAPELDPDAMCFVFDKLDGSLGILYRKPSDGTYAVATRGSFTSAQAVHATKVWEDRYAGVFTPHPDTTYLFEIIYPENRIVLDYADKDDIVFLCGLDNETGMDAEHLWEFRINWIGERVVEFAAGTLTSVLADEPRPNAEGYVLYFPKTGDRLKVKQADYVALHRIMTQVTPRIIWEYLAVNACKSRIPADKPKMWETSLHMSASRAAEVLAVGPDWLEKLAEQVPDEFHAWLKSTVAEILQRRLNVKDQIDQSYEALREVCGDDRAAFAKLAKQSIFFGELFLLYDGRDIFTNLWARVYPEAARPWMTVNEDVA